MRWRTRADCALIQHTIQQSLVRGTRYQKSSTDDSPSPLSAGKKKNQNSAIGLLKLGFHTGFSPSVLTTPRVPETPATFSWKFVALKTGRMIVKRAGVVINF